VRVHPPETVRAGVVVLAPRAGRRLAVRSRLDVATHGEDQPLRRSSDLGHGGVERGEVAGGGNAEPADLADVLTRGGFDLARRGWIVLVAEGADASTHGASVPQLERGARSHRLPCREGVVMWVLFLDRKEEP
jgi:hypothetical protein